MTTKPNMRTSSEQEIFDYVTRFLFAQNKQAVERSTTVCRYYMIDGDKECMCAIGALMPDPKKYEHSYSTIRGILNRHVLDINDGVVDFGFTPEGMRSDEENDRIRFLMRLQTVHDGNPVSRWHQAFAKFAEERDLKFV